MQINQPAAPPRPLRVFVHLARDKDADHWLAAKAAGRLVGVNDDTPYGYGRAAHMGAEVEFSRSHRENRLQALLRLALRVALGFDLVHAWRQREAMARADCVWTHTESQYLAVAALGLLVNQRPRLLGQTVWLMDRWPKLNFAHRALYRRLARRVDVMTFHSPLNLASAEAAFPGVRRALVRFGIPSEAFVPPRRREGRPIRVLALGSDRHRDWPCLLEAVRGAPDIELRILSGSLRPRTQGNVRIGRARDQQELMAAFAEATLVCVPLKPNLHASGITVMQEAALAGLPIVATDTGGLDAYFARDEAAYVAPGDPQAMRAAIRALADDAGAALAQAQRAQRRMASGEIGAEAYIRRHVELTKEMLS
jgi:glycosyltransferase involved in cell wall biosynthesis